MNQFLWLVLIISCQMITAQSFVQVDNGHFTLEGKPYQYVGMNLWYGMHLASSETGDRARLIRELDRLSELGLTNLRIMAASEGPDHEPWRVIPSLQPSPGKYREHLLEGLDFLISEMGKRDMKAVVCLNNFWPWSGGMAQYVSWTSDTDIPYPPPQEDGKWIAYMFYAAKFYQSSEAEELYLNHIDKIINRTNKITGIPYRLDPTIMSWQLANEPRGMLQPGKYRKWIEVTSNYIRNLDRHHLISIGSEGTTSSRLSGNRFVKDHSLENIDYATIHLWPQNWQWYDPSDPRADFLKTWEKVEAYLNSHMQMAKTLNKPLVLEEFGLARDGGSCLPEAGTTRRDHFLDQILAVFWMSLQSGKMHGCNIWSWSGEGRPREPGGFWGEGHVLIGDPPHEVQGWYGIYDRDSTSLEILSKYAHKCQE